MNNYQTAKEKARQEAIEYQLTQADHDYSYEELMEKKGAYYKLFKLQEEALKFIGIEQETEEKEEKENE